MYNSDYTLLNTQTMMGINVAPFADNQLLKIVEPTI